MSATDWWGYVVRCRDGSLYTGVAIDVAARVESSAGHLTASAEIDPTELGAVGSRRSDGSQRGRGPL